ncbi:hypothetical protein JW964_14265, partial [candidate division KSB1 bacterium]|nr:hypothetical protein [candidate division KSB1 bacterium]
MKLFLRFLIILFIFKGTSSNSQIQFLDNFESSSGWLPFASDGVKIDTSIAQGYSGNCIRMDFDFVTGAGYCGIRKAFPMQL